jgi:hypothetical protein
MTKEELRNSLIQSLTSQGFFVNGHVMPCSQTKNHFRKIQSNSKKEQIKFQSEFIKSNFNLAKTYLRDGNDINPENICLELRMVEEGSIEHTLFRWWNLVWWSVPYQRAYGRQMRFLLWDKSHDAPFGLIGLQSPILKLAVRDAHLKIPAEDLDKVINKSMQAQRIGALPPYNQILGGKMAAFSLASNELRNSYIKKYKGVTTILQERIIDPHLLFITTTSAFGKSSIYNRLKYQDQKVAYSLGFTKGSGTFHITEDLYSEMQSFLKRNKIDINTTFGYGPSRKVKLIDRAFSLLDLREYHYHNIKREVFLFPIAKNLHNVIKNGVRPIYFQRNLQDLTEFWKERWALPRITRDSSYKDFAAKNYLLSAKRNISRWSK